MTLLAAVAPVVLLPAAHRQFSMIPGVEVSPMKDENVQDQLISPEEIRPTTPGLGKRFFVVLAIGFAFVVLAAANPAPIKAAWAEFERIIQLKSDPLPASPAKLSGHEIEGLSSVAPQQQAELLMERAINHYEGAIELIEKNVPGWYGQLEVQRVRSRICSTPPSTLTISASAPPPWKSLWPATIYRNRPKVWTSSSPAFRTSPNIVPGSSGFLVSSAIAAWKPPASKPSFSIASTIPIKPRAPMPSSVSAFSPRTVPSRRFLNRSAAIPRLTSAKEPPAPSPNPACSRRSSACAPSPVSSR